MIGEADWLLRTTGKASRITRFQLETAIQSVHTQHAQTGQTDWAAIALIYEALLRLAPTAGVLVGRPAAIAEAQGAPAGWALLEAVPGDAIKSYQPYWALAAHLFKRMGRSSEASNAYDRAIGLCEDSAVREFLTRRGKQASQTEAGAIKSRRLTACGNGRTRDEPVRRKGSGPRLTRAQFLERPPTRKPPPSQPLPPPALRPARKVQEPPSSQLRTAAAFRRAQPET